ncbi:MAG: 6,7-dimethyl-8-ribityllumazine synthase [Candidatus Curtissbacteria bacterium]|nr:6,7-dimethyl-8-ribityllumazine synthase [Candidatus Curtissbacteria bacterium]
MVSKQKRISIIATSFHKKHVEVMLEEARKTCGEVRLAVANEVWVPGSLETPLALQRELMSEKVDGAVVLGIIERGETKHGLVMGMAVISAIIEIQLQAGKPIGVGILGPEITPDQIKPRLKPYAKDAVLAAWAMLK